MPRPSHRSRPPIAARSRTARRPAAGRRRVRAAALLLTVAAVASACVPEPPPPPPSGVEYRVDPTVLPSQPTLPADGTTLELVALREGPTGDPSVTTFVADEVAVTPRSRSELDGFLARTGGRIVGDDAVPLPPASSGIVLDPADVQARTYRVRLDPRSFPLDGLTADAAALGLRGDVAFTSERAARLAALVADARAAGLDVGLNPVAQPDWLRTAAEGSNVGNQVGNFTGPIDAMTLPEWDSDEPPNGSGSSMDRAWQYVAETAIQRRTKVAIIDGGFWLDPLGVPNDPPGHGTDLDPGIAPLQYDFDDGDPFAGGPNPSSCEDGVDCAWHGHNSASAALARVGNGRAAAGSGGQVADPMLFKVSLVGTDVVMAVRTAAAWGADVINMSFGFDCDVFCSAFTGGLQIEGGFQEAANRGAILVASAGNADEDADGQIPCTLSAVICVGAVDPGSSGRASYSNHGVDVDLWAPSAVWTMPVPVRSPIAKCPVTVAAEQCLYRANGTSTSAPVVAGVIAMLRALDPSITRQRAQQVLQETAWRPDRTRDPLVTHLINAFAAVRTVGGERLRPDRTEPNDDVATRPALPLPLALSDLNLDTPADVDRFPLATAGGPGRVSIATTAPTWFSRPRARLERTTPGQCGTIRDVGTTTTTDSRGVETTTRTFEIPALTTTAAVSRSEQRVTPYDLSVTREGQGVVIDAFEPPTGPRNDTRAAASLLFTNSVSLAGSFHDPLGDVDWYTGRSSGSFTSTLTGGMRYSVGILSTDVPIRVDVFDAAGTLIAGAQSGPDCADLPQIPVPQGSYHLRVQPLNPTAVGNYRFTAREETVRGRLYDQRAFWRILLDPSIPVQFDLREPATRYFGIATQALRQVGNFTVRSATPGTTDSRLLDADGNVLAEGVATPAGERFPTAGLVVDEPYILETERTAAALEGVEVPVTVETDPLPPPVPPFPGFQGFVPDPEIPVAPSQMQGRVAVHTTGLAPNQPIWLSQCVQAPFGIPEFRYETYCLTATTTQVNADANGNLNAWFDLYRLRPQPGQRWLCGARTDSALLPPPGYLFPGQCDVWMSSAPPTEPPRRGEFNSDKQLKFIFNTSLTP